MINTILGTKREMKQVFTPSGRRVPVTVVKSGPNTVIQKKTEDKDGYMSLQLGFGHRRIKNLKKPVLGHIKGALKDDKIAPRFLREVSLAADSEHKSGDVINPSDVLKPGDIAQVTGVSKGKGFAGVVKRWHFAGGPKTHGQSDRHRAPGSIGQGTTPGRVWKGKKMAGRMGGEQNTVKNLVVVRVDKETGEIEVSGPVPGAMNSLLLITKIGEKKNFEEVYDSVQPAADSEQQEETDEKKGEENAREKSDK